MAETGILESQQVLLAVHIRSRNLTQELDMVGHF
jgi:hypothetical protein